NKELHAKYDKKFGKDMNYYVPTKTLFWSFRVMTVAGGLFALIAIIGLYFNRAKSTLIERQRWFLWVLGICTFLPFAANTAGWLITELGRYPWVVYGLLTIADAVSPNVSVASLLISNIVYFCLFSGLGIVMIVLSRRALHQGPDDLLQASDDAPYDPYGKEAFSHE
ncbi:cytochrome ubiquinol oxidase subunit I, partial [Lactiplantibacillus plantarum]